MEIRPGGAGLIYADREAGGRTDMTKVIGPVRDWRKNASKNPDANWRFFPSFCRKQNKFTEVFTEGARYWRPILTKFRVCKQI
jgi:hypothetical protein